MAMYDDDDETAREPVHLDPEDVERNLEALLRMTQADHWFDYGMDAAPSLKRSGCDLAGAAFQISCVGSVERQFEDYSDGTVNIRMYHASGKFVRHGSDRIIDAQGSCGTDEPSFTSRSWITKSEVLAQARSKAETRMWSDAIRRLLGIGSITWGDLEAAGIIRANVMKKKEKPGRNYAPQSQAQGQPQGQPQTKKQEAAPQQEVPRASEQQTKDIAAYVKALGLTKQQVGEMLRAAGNNVAGWPPAAAAADVFIKECAKRCRDASLTDPVTGEVHSKPEPETQPSAATPTSTTPPIDVDDIPF